MTWLTVSATFHIYGGDSIFVVGLLAVSIHKFEECENKVYPAQLSFLLFWQLHMSLGLEIIKLAWHFTSYLFCFASGVHLCLLHLYGLKVILDQTMPGVTLGENFNCFSSFWESAFMSFRWLFYEKLLLPFFVCEPASELLCISLKLLQGFPRNCVSFIRQVRDVI